MNAHKLTPGTERSFGLVLAIVFICIAIWPVLFNETIRIWALLIASTLLFLALFIPKSLKLANLLWFKLGMLLGTVVTPIVMALLFFLTIVPTGLIMKAMGKDLLSQRMNKTTASYWISRKEPVGTMKNQF